MTDGCQTLSVVRPRPARIGVVDDPAQAGNEGLVARDIDDLGKVFRPCVGGDVRVPRRMDDQRSPERPGLTPHALKADLRPQMADNNSTPSTHLPS